MPNHLVLLELAVLVLSLGNGVLGLWKGGLFLGRRFVFRIDEPRLWRRTIRDSFGFAALIALHLTAVAVTRILS